MIYITYDPKIISFRVLGDDKVQIWGLYNGLQDYVTVMGSTTLHCLQHHTFNEENKDNTATSTTTSVLPALLHDTLTPSIVAVIR